MSDRYGRLLVEDVDSRQEHVKKVGLHGLQIVEKSEAA